MNVSTAKNKVQAVMATGRERLAEKRLARVEEKYESLRSENEVLRREFKENQALQERLLKTLETRPSSDQTEVRQKPRRRWFRVLVLGGAAAALVTRREQIARWVRQTWGGAEDLYESERQSLPETGPTVAPTGDAASSAAHQSEIRQ
jgi:uncharacterized protein YigA (DUF484 family)